MKVQGQAQLKEWLRPKGQRVEGRSQTSLADMLGISQSAVALWLSGKTRPGEHHRKLLKAYCGIPLDAWLTKAEAKQLDRAEQAAGGAP